MAVHGADHMADLGFMLAYLLAQSCRNWIVSHAMDHSHSAHAKHIVCFGAQMREL